MPDGWLGGAGAGWQPCQPIGKKQVAINLIASYSRTHWTRALNSLKLLTQIGRPDSRVIEQRLGLAIHGDVAGLHDIAPVRNA